MAYYVFYEPTKYHEIAYIQAGDQAYLRCGDMGLIGGVYRNGRPAGCVMDVPPPDLRLCSRCATCRGPATGPRP